MSDQASPALTKPTGSCYHCGEPIPLNAAFTATIGGKKRQVCSARCQETANWISQNGLGDFYRLRSGKSFRPGAVTDDHKWDTPELQQHVLKKRKDGLDEVRLLIEGIHCAGCIWLIERALLKLGKVSDIQINPITHKASLAFDSSQLSLERILDTITQAGYQPRPLALESISNARTDENRDLLKRLMVAGFGMMQVMTFAFVTYLDGVHTLPPGTNELFRWLGFLVATPVVFYSGIPFYRGAKNALKMKSLNMDVPIAIAVSAVYLASAFQAIMQQGDVYFESATMLVFFLLTGRYLEMRARHHSVDSADALINLTPSFAERRKADGTLEKILVSQLLPGDRIHIAEGAHVPADGQLITQQARMDESLLSGESNAQARNKGEAIIAGSLVLQGPIDVLVTRTGDDTFLSTLANLSTQAQTERPKLARKNEQATARFVARVLVFTSVTLIGWLWYDPSQALEATIALLVVACPCALGLAAPAAITRALGVLAKRNILVVKPDALETLNLIDHAVFDKTGTLTEPMLDKTDLDPDMLQLAASLGRESHHPLSKALVTANTLPLLAVDDVKSHPGMGMEGTINGRHLKLGQAAYVLADDQSLSLADAELVLGENGKLLATFNMQETLRPDAVTAIGQLQKSGIQCAIISGDSHPRVQKVAERFDQVNWYARQKPDDKLHLLRQLRDQGRRIMAVGDGSNDAPILAGADVSVALTSGAELAQANADILLCSGKMRSLLECRDIAKETRIILTQNERWAITYNTVAMPFAALGFIPPWLAAIFMSASSLVVVLNALRIGKRTNNESAQAQPAAVVASSHSGSNTSPCCSKANNTAKTASCCSVDDKPAPCCSTSKDNTP